MTHPPEFEDDEDGKDVRALGGSRRRRSLITLLLSSLSVAVAFTTVVRLYQDFKEQNETARIIDRVTIEKSQATREQLEALIDEKLKAVPPNTADVAQLNAAVEKLKADVQGAFDTTLATRQALNPTNPDEILTIARLRDKVVEIERRFDRLEADLDEQYAAFTASTLRQISERGAVTTTLAIALIPLLLNLAYIMWRDFRGSRGPL